MCLESGGQNGGALFADGRGVSVVNVDGGVQTEASVPVVAVTGTPVHPVSRARHLVIRDLVDVTLRIDL
jgi:hypothetical protein